MIRPHRRVTGPGDGAQALRRGLWNDPPAAGRWKRQDDGGGDDAGE